MIVEDDLQKRASALNVRANIVGVKLAKAIAKAAQGRARIPGDGDGDGIPYEGRNKKPGAAGGHNPKAFANRAQEFDHLSKIPPAKRTPEEKARLKFLLPRVAGAAQHYKDPKPGSGSGKASLGEKSAEKLPGGKDKDGFTHKVPGFKPPQTVGGRKDGYGNTMGGKIEGDSEISVGGDLYHFRRPGTNTKTGKPSYEYANDKDERFWVLQDGRAQRD